ncbi:carboxypeptidase-like regulatory domain-containing protein [Puia sp. P3]|uniref:carboxypeptidase-like regulatory domain-containing protein n=1 Tax=Puia sp. P3 TaxID=3423952 RepID=UPI003D6753B7
MRALTILVVLQLLGLAVFAQHPAGKISGKVADANGKGLEAVTVSLLKEKDSVPVRSVGTDAGGQFVFDNVSPGKYRLSVTHIGYLAWSGEQIELNAARPSLSVGAVRLQPSAGASLGQVTVVGKRAPIENKIDKTVVNVDASPTNGGLTALEVLGKVPGCDGRQ